MCEMPVDPATPAERTTEILQEGSQNTTQHLNKTHTFDGNDNHPSYLGLSNLRGIKVTPATAGRWQDGPIYKLREAFPEFPQMVWVFLGIYIACNIILGLPNLKIIPQTRNSMKLVETSSAFKQMPFMTVLCRQHTLVDSKTKDTQVLLLAWYTLESRISTRLVCG